MNRELASKAQRAQAVRALLVSLPQDQTTTPEQAHAASGPRAGRSRGWWVRSVGATAIALVFVLVAYVALTGLRSAPATPAVVPTASTAAPVTEKTTLPVGTVIGSWSSAAKPVSYGGTVSTGGLAIETSITCSGEGSLAVSLSHVSDQDGSCGASNGTPETSRNSGAITRPIVVKIRPHDGTTTWRVVLRTAAPTTFTPVPVRATDDSGNSVPYCSSKQLSAKYVHVPEPEGVTATTTGEAVLTNTSASTCAVSGYPTVSFINSNGDPVGHRANMHTDTKNYSTRRTLAPVLVQPAGHAYIQLDVGHADTIKGCRPVTVHTLRVSGNNDGFSTATTFTLSIPAIPACSAPKVLQLFATLYVNYPADLRTPAQITKDATCRLDELAISLRKTPDQASEQTGAIGFTNSGTRTCHLNGTPALTFLTVDQTPTGRHTGVQLHGGDPTRLDDGYTLLASGDTMYVHYAIQTASTIKGCTPTTAKRLQTTTGEFGYTTTVTLPDTVQACSNPSVTQLRATGFITEKDYNLTSLPKK